jgi:high-affinity iron transporter
VTGVLGVQPQPTVGEALGWLLYAVPMLAYVMLPRPVRRQGAPARPVGLSREAA